MLFGCRKEKRCIGVFNDIAHAQEVRGIKFTGPVAGRKNQRKSRFKEALYFAKTSFKKTLLGKQKHCQSWLPYSAVCFCNLSNVTGFRCFANRESVRHLETGDLEFNPMALKYLSSCQPN